MRPRVLALVDGEHYPPVVRAALEQAGREADVVAALLLGGTEKLDGDPEFGVPLERVSGDAATSMLAAAGRHGADRVLDLSDEPVLTEERRMWLAANALAAGLVYEGADFELRPPAREPMSLPALAVVGTGKRVGKTAVS
ncbi:MAG: cyclic 2,3-diphosphoglycerate synthase, partial [Gaiellales bacterium]|nr:cyclic 2,3-diphosphoglycerate synthase [Gaiellales bacterium]